MSYLGNQPNSAAFLTDQFSGNGSTTTWTLSTAPAGTTSILVSVSGILQDPSTYSVVGTTLTLGGAAPTGTGNISVRYLGIPASGVVTTAYRTVTEFTATAGQTTFTPPSYSVGFIAVYLNGARLGAADFTATNGTTIVLATGASVDDLVVTESFYISSVANAIPNISNSVTETNIASGAVNLTTKVTGVLPIANGGTGVSGIYVNYLVVAGGGNGGSGNAGGGGGGGGVLYGSTLVTSGTNYTITIGAGGAGSNGYAQNNGSNSAFGSLIAIGGGAGGTNNTGLTGGTSGGSGGGGGGDGGSSTYSVGGAGTDGQGNRGGRGWITGGGNIGGGGGGAGQSGQAADNTATRAGDGGAGFLCNISGSFASYGGGGGGTCQNGQPIGYGATGCGGDGGTSAGSPGGNGVANRGGGGGGAVEVGNANSGSGGSGVVIISYQGSQRGTGGTVTSSGGYTIHTFTSSGTYTA